MKVLYFACEFPSQKTPIQSDVPHGGCFPFQSRVTILYYRCSTTVVNTSKRVTISNSYGVHILESPYFLISNLSPRTPYFKFIQPIYFRHKRFFGNPPARRERREKPPFISLCKPRRTIISTIYF